MPERKRPLPIESEGLQKRMPLRQGVKAQHPSLDGTKSFDWIVGPTEKILSLQELGIWASTDEDSAEWRIGIALEVVECGLPVLAADAGRYRVRRQEQQDSGAIQAALPSRFHRVPLALAGHDLRFDAPLHPGGDLRSDFPVRGGMEMKTVTTQ